jgi:deoxycytidylate deaminase
MMQLAHNLATRSKDPKHKIGCVITDDRIEKIIGMGTQPGFIHAEINAVNSCDPNISNKIVFLTHSPCSTCSKMLVNAGTIRLYYTNLYCKNSLQILTQNGIVVVQLEYKDLWQKQTNISPKQTRPSGWLRMLQRTADRKPFE